MKLTQGTKLKHGRVFMFGSIPDGDNRGNKTLNIK